MEKLKLEKDFGIFRKKVKLVFPWITENFDLKETTASVVKSILEMEHPSPSAITENEGVDIPLSVYP